MYAGDCLIIVMDTSGNEMAKKQFGFASEKDIISELAFDSQNIYIYGSFSGTSTYATGSNPPHYLYKTAKDLSNEESCTSLPITDSSVVISTGNLGLTTSAGITNLLSQVPSATTGIVTSFTFSQSSTELCF